MQYNALSKRANDEKNAAQRAIHHQHSRSSKQKKKQQTRSLLEPCEERQRRNLATRVRLECPREIHVFCPY